MSQQLLSPKSVSDLKRGLSRSEKVVYKSNGFRTTKAEVFFKKIEKILPKVGVKRVANISFMSATKYPVFQSCRPSMFYHSSTGQNTGAQGKGPHLNQALISCAMEAIEGFCAEPREVELIRATYNQIKNQYVVIDPDLYLQNISNPNAKHDEPLMWTKALHLQLGCEVLIPAETVYFPFLNSLYRTKGHFPSSTNGLASGATYLEATIHALYEVIERHYHARLADGKILVEALYEEELVQIGIAETTAAMRGEFELQLYTLEISKIKNLPVVMCLLVGDNQVYYGMGCSSTVEISIDRALSEALQSHATAISGTREDLEELINCEQEVESLFAKVPQPDRRTLRVKDFAKRVHNKRFSNLNKELQFVLKWIRQLGINDVVVANLNREGIDIPVVKVVIPELEQPSDIRTSSRFTADKLFKHKYPSRGS